MKMFGLELVGDASPTSVEGTLPGGIRLPRVYLELCRKWGPGAIGGELYLHWPEQLPASVGLYEREVEIDRELARRSPVDAMPLDEWKNLASFACRDRLELAWVRGREEDGPIWAIDVSMKESARVGSFDELPTLLDAIDRQAPPGEGMRWGFPKTFVAASAASEANAYAEVILRGAPDEVERALDAWEQRQSAFSIYARALGDARLEPDTSERGKAVLSILERRAAAKIGAVP